MTIKELINLLSQIKDKEKNIYMATDEEGNGYNNVFEITQTENGEFILYPDSACLEYGENGEMKQF